MTAPAAPTEHASAKYETMNVAQQQMRARMSPRVAGCLDCQLLAGARALWRLRRGCSLMHTHRLHSSSFLGLPYRILIKYKPEKGTTMEPVGKDPSTLNP